MLLENKDRTQTNAPLAKGESRGFTSETEAAPPAYDALASAQTSGAARASAMPPSNLAADPASTLSGPASTSPLSSAPRSSHVSVYNHNGAIKAAHVLDLAVPIAPALLQAQQQSSSSGRPEELDALGRRPNGYWGSQNGGVKVEVGIRGQESSISLLERQYLDDAGKKGEERVRIVAHSQNGSVKCSVVERAPATTPFTVRATSQNGTVELVLPSSFHGPLALKTSNGSIRLSDGVKARFTPLLDGCGFIGDIADWDGDAEQAEARGWDNALAASRNGSVRVKFWEEVEEEHARPGFFAKLGLFKSSS